MLSRERYEHGCGTRDERLQLEVVLRLIQNRAIQPLHMVVVVDGEMMIAVGRLGVMGAHVPVNDDIRMIEVWSVPMLLPDG